MFPITIRNETKDDFREVEILTRKAFWNVNVLGCDEHYLAHVLRNHEDFIPELDLVAETDNGKIVGNVMYTKAKLEPMKKEFSPSQEEFYIHSHSIIRD